MNLDSTAVTMVTSDSWGQSTSGTSTGVLLTAIGRVAARATYKPGWRFEVRERMMPLDAVLRIHLETHDSDDIERVIPFVHHFFVPREAVEDDELAKQYLLARVHDVERHEMREFFRIDGERFDPPSHDPGTDPYR